MGVSAHAIEEAERMRSSYAQRGQPMPLALRRGELLVSACYVVTALALARIGGFEGSFSWATAALYVTAIAVASQVRFDVGAGFTVPTQAVFVPMLFAFPVGAVPLLVPVGLALGMVPRTVRGEMSASWLLTAVGNSWFAIGPTFVLLLAGTHSPDAPWGVLLLALGAQFGSDFAASAVRERIFGELDIHELLREVQPIYAIDVALSLLGLVVAMAAIGSQSQLPVVLIAPLFVMLRFLSRERHQRLEQLTELNDAYQGTALLLGDVVEADDTYTGEHSKSVVRLALEVADELNLNAEVKRNVEFAALLHDVGKIAVPKEIINKPGKLDDHEWAIIKRHTIEGQNMLEKVGGVMREIGRIVRASHEDWDGGGYPDGLAGEAIPIEARVVCACDAFNAMTTTRSYRKAMPLGAAIAELTRCAGSQFDPHVVRALINVASTDGNNDTQAPDAAPRDNPAVAPAAAGAQSGAIAVTRPAATRAPAATVREVAQLSPTEAVTIERQTPQIAGQHDGSKRSSRAVARRSSASVSRVRDFHAVEVRVIDALADLAVTAGANVQAGQIVDVSGEIGHLDMIRAIVAAAYRRGARFVDARIVDPVLEHTRISIGPHDAIEHVPRWQAERVRDLARQNGASILVAGPTFPTLFDDLDPRTVAQAEIGPSAQWREAEPVINWTVLPAATPGWARQLRPQLPDQESLQALWSDLAYACRLDEPDPLAAWRARLETLRQRAEWLTDLELDEVHLNGPGTSLRIGLFRDAPWACPQMTTPQGIQFLPNLPTEEVYTTPDPARVDGYVRLTRPLPIGGRLIDDIQLRFQDGRVVEITGPPDASVLRAFTARDEGASRLGELALVDSDSRIARLGQTFCDTLLDENAASHIALGRGFAQLLPETNVARANTSDHHLDMMVGAPQIDVTGIDRLGRPHSLVKNDRWNHGLPSCTSRCG